MTEWDRREFLKLLSSLPVAIAIGCGSEGEKAAVKGTPLSPDESLKKLIRVLGPWSSQEKAQDFAVRFVESAHVDAFHLSDSGEAIQALATRFGDDLLAVNKVDLEDLSAAEKDFVLSLAKQIYSLTEVRFVVCKEPQAGECQGDISWHTKVPKN
jgi:hypothetical protein